MINKKMDVGSWYVFVTKYGAIYKGEFVEKEKVESHHLFSYRFKNARMYNKTKERWNKSQYTLSITLWKIKKIRKLREENSFIPISFRKALPKP